MYVVWKAIVAATLLATPAPILSAVIDKMEAGKGVSATSD